MHIDERKCSHRESRYVAYTNHDLLYWDKGEAQKADKLIAGCRSSTGISINVEKGKK